MSLLTGYMNEKKFIFITIAVTILIIAGAVIFLGKSESQKPQVAAVTNVSLTTDSTSFDWGTIKLKGGKVDKTFTITNTGSDTLKLYEVVTSCLCTTAQVKINGNVSPYFAMHQKSSWVGEVAPGETAELEVVFDPAFHGPQGVGDITRMITVKTNAQSQPEVSFNLTAKVVN